MQAFDVSQFFPNEKIHCAAWVPNLCAGKMYFLLGHGHSHISLVRLNDGEMNVEFQIDVDQIPTIITSSHWSDSKMYFAVGFINGNVELFIASFDDPNALVIKSLRGVCSDSDGRIVTSLTFNFLCGYQEAKHPLLLVAKANVILVSLFYNQPFEVLTLPTITSICSINCSEESFFRIYTVDGQLFVTDIKWTPENDFEISPLVDKTAYFSSQITASEDLQDNENSDTDSIQGNDDAVTQKLIYGVTSSKHQLFDAVIYV